MVLASSRALLRERLPPLPLRGGRADPGRAAGPGRLALARATVVGVEWVMLLLLALACPPTTADCATSSGTEGAVGCTVYFQDADGDGFGDPAAFRCLCAPDGAWTATVANDCYDANADAFPGQVAYFEVDRGDGSFDHDCDGTEEVEGGVAECPTVKGVTWCGWDRAGVAPFVPGWVGAPPDCGTSGNYAHDCATLLTCSFLTEVLMAACR